MAAATREAAAAAERLAHAAEADEEQEPEFSDTSTAAAA